MCEKDRIVEQAARIKSYPNNWDSYDAQPYLPAFVDDIAQLGCDIITLLMQYVPYSKRLQAELLPFNCGLMLEIYNSHGIMVINAFDEPSTNLCVELYSFFGKSTGSDVEITVDMANCVELVKRLCENTDHSDISRLFDVGQVNVRKLLSIEQSAVTIEQSDNCDNGI